MKKYILAAAAFGAFIIAASAGLSYTIAKDVSFRRADVVTKTVARGYVTAAATDIAKSVSETVSADTTRRYLASIEPGGHQLRVILRPDVHGNWYVQDDASHAPLGMRSFVKQTADSVRIFYDRLYSKAATIQISSDDGFGARVTGHASLGLDSATINVFVDGKKIDPARIWDYLPEEKLAGPNGNFWINVTMIE